MKKIIIGTLATFGALSITGVLMIVGACLLTGLDKDEDEYVDEAEEF